MDDRKLNGLLAVVHAGSFSKASKKLCCTQSAVTQMINSLESELNCKLLLRNHSGIKLTSAGKLLLPYIEAADNALACLKEEADKISNGKVRPIRIGAFSSISKSWLPPLLKAYQELHPDVIFDIRIGTNKVADWLDAGEIDVALGDDCRCENYHWYPLMDDPFYAVLPANSVTDKKKTISQQELIKYPFIMAPMNALKKQMQALPEKPLNVNCDDDTTLLSMVEEGLGVTIMPKLSLLFASNRIQILELDPPMKREIGIALPDMVRTSVSDFVAFLKRSCPRNI